MNIAKNMEAIFLVTAALIIGTGYAQAGAGTAAPLNRAAASAAQAAAQAPLQVVTISAKRMTAMEKAAFDNAE